MSEWNGRAGGRVDEALEHSRALLAHFDLQLEPVFVTKSAV